jgi:hypothetical protein
MSVESTQVIEGAAVARKSKAKNGRSRITNHRDLLPKIADGRKSQARRFRDLVNSLLAQVSKGGTEHVPEDKVGLIRQYAAATILSEEYSAKIVNGEPVDSERYCTLASTQLRLARQIGFNRVPPRPSEPSLDQYRGESKQESEDVEPPIEEEVA